MYDYASISSFYIKVIIILIMGKNALSIFHMLDGKSESKKVEINRKYISSLIYKENKLY